MRRIDAVIDTGFTDVLTLPLHDVQQLGLMPVASMSPASTTYSSCVQFNPVWGGVGAAAEPFPSIAECCTEFTGGYSQGHATDRNSRGAHYAPT